MSEEEIEVECLHYSYGYGAPTEHPQKALKRIGVTYKLAVPQSMFDCWQFFLPEGLPEVLPDHMKLKKLNPYKMIGYGLNKENAEYLIKASNPSIGEK